MPLWVYRRVLVPWRAGASASLAGGSGTAVPAEATFWV